MRDHLRAGIALYNQGRFHRAHDAWEDHWLGLQSGTDEERLLHGLIQFTATVYHATEQNWAGVVGLADSAETYLTALPPQYREVNVDDLREYLRTIETDPAVIERRSSVPILHEGERVTYETLDEPALWIAAGILAEADGVDPGLIDRAIEYTEENDRIRTLLADFVRDPENRAVVANRLEAHVDRHESRRADVEGLFE
jgi:predicted metal-dependent hydrolase